MTLAFLRNPHRQPCAAALLPLLVIAMTTGCSAVHSGSVKRLIAIEGEKLKEAATQAESFSAEDAQKQVRTFQKSVDDLDRAMTNLQAEEAKYGLVLASFQNVATKTGTDAAAFSYFAGRIYLTDQDGLSGEVKKQFADAEGALTSLSQQLVESWKQMLALHQKLADYANRSALASVDDAFVKAVVEQVPGASENVDAVLTRTKELNDRLEQASALGFGKVEGVVQVRSAVGDLIDLLDRVKKR